MTPSTFGIGTFIHLPALLDNVAVLYLVLGPYLSIPMWLLGCCSPSPSPFDYPPASARTFRSTAAFGSKSMACGTSGRKLRGFPSAVGALLPGCCCYGVTPSHSNNYDLQDSKTSKTIAIQKCGPLRKAYGCLGNATGE